MPSPLDRVRAVIFDVFHNIIDEDDDEARRIIAASTYIGREDPGGWSPEAEVVIHCESGIPNGAYDDNCKVIDLWSEVSRRLGDLFCEHFNAAIICVYPS